MALSPSGWPAGVPTGGAAHRSGAGDLGHGARAGAVADRAGAQEVQLAIAAKPDAVDVPFWRAVLGYDELVDDNAVDPLGHGSTVWMQELDPAKPLRHAMATGYASPPGRTGRFRPPGRPDRPNRPRSAEPRRRAMNEERHPMGEQPSTRTPVTYDRSAHIEGPFYHGTKLAIEVGAELVAGYGSNFQEGRVSNNIYFSALVETAAWGAELSTALAGMEDRGHIYVVDPLGPFEDDPNVTDKRFPGNPTQSYRTRHPLRVVEEVETWEGHAPELVKSMLDHLAQIREQGLDVIED
jgi:rifampin ADP-ribosylating transferase